MPATDRRTRRRKPAVATTAREVPAEFRDAWRLIDVARCIGIGRTTAQQMKNAGALPLPLRIPHTTIEVWRPQEIRDWIAKGMPSAAQWRWTPPQHEAVTP